MPSYKSVNIFASVLALAGLALQLYTDSQSDMDHRYGFYIVILSLFISGGNQLRKQQV